MGINLEPYFVEDVNIQMALGDSFNGNGLDVQKENNGVLFSFADYTITGILYDRQENIVANLSVSKSTSSDAPAGVTSDLLLIEGNASDMPTEAGLYRYVVRAVNVNNSEQVFTIISGQVTVKDLKSF